MNIKVLNLVLEIIEKTFSIQHECVRVNPRRKWNHDQCRCKGKELDYQGSHKNNYM